MVFSFSFERMRGRKKERKNGTIGKEVGREDLIRAEKEEYY